MKLPQQTLEILQSLKIDTNELASAINVILNNEIYPTPSDCCELKDTISCDIHRILNGIRKVNSLGGILEEELNELIPPQKTFKDYLNKLKEKE